MYQRTQPTRLIIMVIALIGGLSSVASAQSNEITLQNFGECVEAAGSDTLCRGVELDEAGFRSFANELGLAFAPYALAPAETLGVSGFAIQIDHNISAINSDEDYWRRAMVDGEAPSSLHVSQLHLRKGLPFSFEVGALTSVWWGSELVAFGGEVKWALHEDTLWPLPSLGVRGWGNVVLGSKQLRLYNAGVDISVGVPFGIGGVVQLTPYLGYSLHAVISGSNIIDATPGDPTPPFERPEGSTEPGNQPEFVFGNDTNINHRLMGGLRIRVTHLEMTVQVTGLEDVLTTSLSLGTTF